MNKGVTSSVNRREFIVLTSVTLGALAIPGIARAENHTAIPENGGAVSVPAANILREMSTVDLIPRPRVWQRQNGQATLTLESTGIYLERGMSGDRFTLLDVRCGFPQERIRSTFGEGVVEELMQEISRFQA